MEGVIEGKIGRKPTDDQRKAIEGFVDFFFSRQPNTLFLLTGYAGTGKTTLVGAIVKTLLEMQQRVVLLAPTGRAAKVFSQHAESPAYTIHRRLYRETSGVAFDTSVESGQLMARNQSSFSLNPAQLNHQTLFIVDEASMIANEGLAGGLFGSGRLLDDLVSYVYGGENCRLMLVGDGAQLPPVGEEHSVALDGDALAAYGLEVRHCHLSQVVRQWSESGVLWNATLLRNIIELAYFDSFPQLRVRQFSDIEVVPGDELIERLEDSYYHVGSDETIVVTRSNKRAGIFNNGIRGRILGYEEELGSGDHLIVAKNNYFWLRPDASKEESSPLSSPSSSAVSLPASPTALPSTSANPFASSPITSSAQSRPLASSHSHLSQQAFIANGDMAVVRSLHNERELYGFRFADVSLQFPDYDDLEVECTVLLDTLQAEAPALTRAQQDVLFNAVWEDYPDITNRRDRMKRLREDIYYNALQVKYAYAITCHKAQGGQWQHVYIDQGYVTEDMLTPNYFRWLYTALTRATERVFLINWPKEQVDERDASEDDDSDEE